MPRGKEVYIIAQVLETYKRILTYRPHLSEEVRRGLVQKKLEEDLGINITLEDINTYLANHPEEVPEKKERRPVRLVKRDTTKGSWCLKTLPKERKRDYKDISEENFATIKPCNTSSPVKFSKKLDFTDSSSGSSLKSGPSNSTAARHVSKIPRPLFKFGKPSSEVHVEPHNVFDRLYQQRRIPCHHKVELVRFVKDVWTSRHKKQVKPQVCAFHGPPHKRSRYSGECSNGTLNSSVYERLYSERKQLNTKQLTDSQVRELYLKKQRERLRSIQRQRMSQLSCAKYGRDLGSINDTSESSDSGEEVSDVLSEISTLSADTLNENQVPDSTLKPSNLDNDNDDVEGSLKNMHVILDGLTKRFNENMSLCPIVEGEFTN